MALPALPALPALSGVSALSPTHAVPAISALSAGLAWPSRAEATGPVVLTVSGPLRVGTAVHFDMAALTQLPQKELVSTTPWYGSPRSFTGPLLRDVLAAAGAPAQMQRIRATALNDYRVEIPVDDLQRYDVILARLLDGQPMAVRDKGPLFVMYPFDGHPELNGALHYSRAIWQLRRLEVQ